ncbi:hypothetical protein Y032_0244g3537, partial [Ancylostoma ceylanicum]
MSSCCKHIVAGITSNGETICIGVVEAEDGTVAPTVHHVSSMNKFEAEDWDGEHAETHYEQAMDDDDAQHLSFSAEPAEPETPTATTKRDEDTPIASSAQFERNRSASLAEALLHIDPNSVPQVGFFHPSTVIPLLEAEESEERVPSPVAVSGTEATPGELPESGDAERVITDLLFTLRALKMAAPDRHAAAVNRLRELEEELRTAGAVTPADPAVADAVARALTAAGPGRDVQIRVNQSRHTTTTKTVYETETPGMVGLEPEKIRELHQQMLGSLRTTQKKETAEEGYTNEDGSVVVSKKMTRVVTTTKTTLPESSPSTYGSVRERIARFESLQEMKSTKSSPDKLSVDIVVTPGTPAPDLESDHEDVAQEPLSPSIESEVSQAEVKSSSSYSGEEHVPRDFGEREGREKRAVTEIMYKPVPSPTAAQVIEEVPHEEEKTFVDEYGAHPSTFIETTREEIIELEERSESPQPTMPPKPAEDEELEVIPAIPVQEEMPDEGSPKLAETRTTFVSTGYYDKPDILTRKTREEEKQEEIPHEVGFAPPKYEDISKETAHPREEHEYRTVKKTVTTVTTTRYMEIPEAPTPEPNVEEFAKESSPYSAPHVPTAEELEYPSLTKTVTTVTTTSYMEVPETPEEEQHIADNLLEVQKTAPTEEEKHEPIQAVDEEIIPTTGEEHPPVKDTVTTVTTTRYEVKPEGAEEFERYMERESPKAVESPVSPITAEEYPPLKETVTTVTTTRYEVKPEGAEEFERYMERESPKAVESPVSPTTAEEYPPVKETVTTVTTTRYEVKPEGAEEFERYMERESPKAVESPVSP